MSDLHFFFYGTLLAGNANPVAREIHAALEPLGRAETEGVIHAIPDPAGWFPALLPGAGRVQGALYRAGPGFSAAQLARMDAYEDFDPDDLTGSLYQRVPMTVHLAGGGTVIAQVYRWNRPLPPGAIAVPAGDFSAWLAERGATVFAATRNAS